MRQSLFSIITLLVFSFVLTACSSTSAGDSSNPLTTSNPLTINPRDTSETPQYVSPINSITAVSSPEPSTEYVSLTTASATANNTDTSTDFTLKGLAVQGDYATIYTRETKDIEWHVNDEPNTKLTTSKAGVISRITSPAVTLTFADDGAASVKTAYLDKEYPTDDASVTLAVDRSSSFFGFDSDYMAYISWNTDNALDTTDTENLTQTIDSKDGAMIAGIETAFTDIPNIAGKVTFTGAGKGVYGVLDTDTLSRYDTNFTATADVDFVTRLVDIKTTDTACGECDLSDDTLALLNFTASGLSFANSNKTASVNNIIGAVTIDTSLIGTVDARFYGTNAQEFGGTFALSDATEGNHRYYYGVFGGLNNGYGYQKIFDAPVTTSAADLPSATNTDDLNSFTTAFNTSDDENLTGLKTFGVERFVEHIHRRDASEIGTDWAAADVTAQTEPYTARIRRSDDAKFDITIGKSMKNPTLYFAENKLFGGGNSISGGGRLYNGDINNGVLDANNLPSDHHYSNSLFSNTFDIEGQVNRTATQPSFISKYMIFIRWKGLRSYSANLLNPNNKRLDRNATEDRTYEVVAFAVAGFETAYDNIPKTGTAVFNGNAVGNYNAEAKYGYGPGIQSDIRVDINFAERTAQFTASKACAICENSDPAVVAADLAEYAHLNFTTQKTRYDDAYSGTAGKNQMFANATTQGDGDNPAMKGMIEARFYGHGTGTEAVKELGGIFAFQGEGDHSGRIYAGRFGTKK